MIGADRFHILLGAILSIFIILLGMTPALAHLPYPMTGFWPIAGMMFAISCSRLHMSIWAATCVIVVGFVQDFVSESPIGAWPLAFLASYGAGLFANHKLIAVTSTFPRELPALILGLFAGVNVLSIAGDVAGGANVIDASLWANVIFTVGLYYWVTPFLAPNRETLAK